MTTQVSTTPNPVPKCQMYIVPARHIPAAQSYTNSHLHILFFSLLQSNDTTQSVNHTQPYAQVSDAHCACLPHSNSTITHQLSLCSHHTTICDHTTAMHSIQHFVHALVPLRLLRTTQHQRTAHEILFVFVPHTAAIQIANNTHRRAPFPTRPTTNH